MRQGTRTRIDTGIYEDATGYAAVVNVGSARREKRFDRTTALRVIRAWQDTTRVALRQQLAHTPAPRSGADETFREVAARYLPTITSMPSYRDRANDIHAWITVFGDRPHAAITPMEIRAQLERWRGRFAASTVNHRRTALQHVYRTLNGRRGHNPAAETEKYPEPAPMPRGVSYVVVRAILAALNDWGGVTIPETQRRPHSLARARLMVMAYTGLPPARLKRLTPDDVDLAAGTMRLAGREKGEGTDARVLPMSTEAVAAFRHFAALNCWGWFANSAVYRAFRLACTKVRAEGILVPADMRPYDLRHAFGTTTLASTGSITTTQLLLDHANPKTTLRYVGAAIPEHLRRAMHHVSLAQTGE